MVTSRGQDDAAGDGGAIDAVEEGAVLDEFQLGGGLVEIGGGDVLPDGARQAGDGGVKVFMRIGQMQRAEAAHGEACNGAGPACPYGPAVSFRHARADRR